MKPEKQRIAIAKACGWTNCCADNPMGSPSTGPIGCPSGRNIGEIWHEMRPLPDYLNSLDAMHEAEDKLQVHYSQAWSDTIVDIAIKQTSLDPEDLNGTERIGCFLSLGFPQPTAPKPSCVASTFGKMTTEQLKHELKVWHSRAHAHEENYMQMLKRVDAIASEYRSFALAVRLSFEHGAFTESTQGEFEQWLRDNAPFITRNDADACRECGTFEEPCFSRIEPMGYFCPNCGTETK